jgi:general secretion pathway protein I
MPGGRRQAARGFTLLEVLLAFTLLAVAMGLLISSLGGGLRQVAEAEYETEAALHAQSILDGLGTLQPIRVGTADGESADGRFRWTMSVEEIEDPAPRDALAAAPDAIAVPLEGQVRVLRVLLDVKWGAGTERQTLHFVTLRVRTPEAEGTP